MHVFADKLRQGEAAENFLDNHFSEWFEIARVTAKDQRRGLDRIYKRRRDGRTFSVEYKADWVAQESHNAFVETISVDSVGKSGWAYTCQADLLFYYVIGDELLYMWRPAKLRQLLPRWERLFPTVSSQNEGYRTHGILVPLAEFERYANKVISL